MLRTIPEGIVTVQDVNVLMDSQNIPEWLDGTPILVDTVSMDIYKGSDAIYYTADLINTQNVDDTTSDSGTPIENPSSDIGGVDDVFEIDKDAQEGAKAAQDSKITSDDIQKLLEERNRLVKHPQAM